MTAQSSLLIDSCVLLWLAHAPGKLSPDVRSRIEDPAVSIFLSSISVYEISLKYAMGKLDLNMAPDELTKEVRDEYGIESLPFTEQACLFLPKLPHHHGDPFDRMLLCQTLESGLVLASPDRILHRYPVPLLW